MHSEGSLHSQAMERLRDTAIWQDVSPKSFLEEIVPAYRPAILKRLVGDWPAVLAAKQSPAAIRDYLCALDQGVPVEVFVGSPGNSQRFFYDETVRGFNFERKRARLSAVLDRLLKLADDANASATYAGAISIPDNMPGFGAANVLTLVPKGTAPRLWVGNATVVSTHYDLADNIACVASGKRRFTLFPPDQVGNLYVGPLEHTMAGQPVSMVDLQAPDLQRYPRFREALAVAEVAELEPGDAIYVPSLWWHHVEAQGTFNVLVNYWWNQGAAHAGSPFEVLIHGLMSIRDLPQPQREAWRGIFDHYLFGQSNDAALHLPPEARGVLGAASPERSRMIRGFLQRALARG